MSERAGGLASVPSRPDRPGLARRLERIAAPKRRIQLGLTTMGATFGLWAVALAMGGVDVPRQDQWGPPVVQILAWQQGSLDWATLGDQHNESRKVFPNLVSIGVTASAGHFDVARELFVGWGLGLLTTGLVARLAWGLRRRADDAVLVAALYVGLSWSAHTRDLHLYSVTFERLLVDASLLVALTGLSVRGATPGAVGLAACCAFVAQFSFAGGFVVWGLVWAWLVWCEGLGSGVARARLGVVALAAGASSALFFDGYVAVNAPPPGEGLGLASIPSATLFGLLYIGNAVTSSRLLLAALFGAGVCAAFLGLAWQVLREAGDARRSASGGEARRARGAWVALGVLSLSQGALAMAGRLWMGLDHATRNDYVGHPVLLWTAVGALGLASTEARVRRAAAALAVTAALWSLLTLSLPGFWRGVRGDAQYLEWARACHWLEPEQGLEDCRAVLFAPAAGRAAMLVRARPVLAEPLRSMRAPELGAAIDGEAYARHASAGGLRVSGTARIGRSPAKAVAVGVDGPSGLRVVAVVPVGLAGPGASMPPGQRLDADAWVAEIAAAPRSPSACAIRSYAVDIDAATLHPIETRCGDLDLRGSPAVLPEGERSVTGWSAWRWPS